MLSITGLPFPPSARAITFSRKMRIEITNLTAGYDGRRILRDLNLTVENKATVTLLGTSGTGKSTFLRILSGLPPRQGQQITGNIRIDQRPPVKILEAGEVGFMFQEPALLPHLTVAENIRLPLELRNADPAYAEYLIERIGLGKDRDRLPRELSGGMKTRVALARTLAPQPRLLLLDEPFSALDVAWRFRLYRELVALQSEIPAITLLVTHDIQEALLLSHRILVLGHSGEFIRDMVIRDSASPISTADPIGGFQREFRELHDLFINEKDTSLS